MSVSTYGLVQIDGELSVLPLRVGVGRRLAAVPSRGFNRATQGRAMRHADFIEAYSPMLKTRT